MTRYIIVPVDDDVSIADFCNAMEAGEEMLDLHGTVTPGDCGDKFCTAKDHKFMIDDAHILRHAAEELRKEIEGE